MSERKEIIQALRDIVEAYDWWCRDPYDNCQSVIHDAIVDSREILDRESVRNTRADLTPRWRPIGEWDGKGYVVFWDARGFPTEDIPDATHFMQLTPPSA